MNKEILSRYAALKRDIAQAETELDELKPQVIEMMGDNDAIETDFGTFSISKRRTWTYTPALTEKEKQLKVDKKLEEQLGTATYTEAPVLMYRQLTNKENND
jgi:regulator of replication initiation timing